MKLEICVIAQEFVKPSSPTPDHLPHHLSFLDQIVPPVYMPWILFYPNDNYFSDQERRDRIKNSLSEILTLFYPLAGRLKDTNAYVECNDEGARFVEAKANCSLSRILDHPNPCELNEFLPFEFYDVSDMPLVVQLTFFECGGLALGIGMCHKLGDALSMLMFIRSWAAIARGGNDVNAPRFDLANLFPPKNLVGFNPGVGIMREKIVTKRFVFPNSSIESIRKKASDKTESAIRATRVEALSAFIWSRFVASTRVGINQDGKIYTLLHTVNLRSRADPPLPQNLFGNFMRFTVTIPTVNADNDQEEGYPLNSIVKQIREDIRKVDAEYVKELQGNDQGHLNFLKERSSSFLKGEIVSFSFTSLCRFPMYEADFGWGKPVWVASARMSYKNLVIFLDTKQGDGIEVWINLEEENMAKLEEDEQLLFHVSSDPRVETSA